MANKAPNIGNLELTMSAGAALDFMATFLGDSRESVMLWGGPGIGKSAIVTQLAKRLGLKGPIDIRLATLDSTVIGGIPARDPVDPTKMTMLRPDFWPDEEDWLVNLDEFSNCPPAIQNVALQVLLDKRIHTHKLPASTVIVATGNRAQDGAWVNRLSLPSANRMKHITIEPRWQDVRDFYKSQTNISQYIVSFLDHKPDFLYMLPQDHNVMAFPTPRSWAHFGNSLQALANSGNAKLSTVSNLAICTIGKGAAMEFEQFMQLANTVSAEDIIEKGKIPKLDPRDPGLMYAASGAVVTYFLTKVGTATNKLKDYHVKHLMDFLQSLPTEFMTATFKDMNWMKNKSHYEACKKHDYDRFSKLSINLKDVLGS